jgi:hypothetical protein
MQPPKPVCDMAWLPFILGAIKQALAAIVLAADLSLEL